VATPLVACRVIVLSLRKIFLQTCKTHSSNVNSVIFTVPSHVCFILADVLLYWKVFSTRFLLIIHMFVGFSSEN